MSAFAIAIARRANFTASSQGSAEPPPCSSSLTILRPGSSTVEKPRRASSVSSVDFPPPEHPEMMTKRSMMSVPKADEVFLIGSKASPLLHSSPQ